MVYDGDKLVSSIVLQLLTYLWGCWILNLPIRFGMDIWYCLGRDHTTQGRAQHTHYSSVGMLRLV